MLRISEYLKISEEYWHSLWFLGPFVMAGYVRWSRWSRKKDFLISIDTLFNPLHMYCGHSPCLCIPSLYSGNNTSKILPSTAFLFYYW
ncbi:hypothetical protein BT96DRAFT_120077 [Gymnopus androsaceus JB14]|uniref:Uncharacterized protein n=1 Tax=Gymnopus androsaceus JB14 TaxID=1447944 RepID=A0A6A4HG32_9AGAR|nr:hypothetical protein BT96DRAFT_120077 [Gymnopus androsaceus JB14]